MTRKLIPALLLSLIAMPALANVGPSFLPDLTFPAPVQQPDVSTQGCATTQTDLCK